MVAVADVPAALPEAVAVPQPVTIEVAEASTTLRYLKLLAATYVPSLKTVSKSNSVERTNAHSTVGVHLLTNRLEASRLRKGALLLYGTSNPKHINCEIKLANSMRASPASLD